MNEIITTYDLQTDPDTALPMPRDEFYLEQIARAQRNEPPSKAVGIVNILLFDEEGELFIQKRSSQKYHNPGLLDKSIGGHIQYGDSAQYTVMVETVQELQIPSITLLTNEEFTKTYRLLSRYLNTIAVVKHIDTKTHIFEKIIQETKVKIANKVFLYFGVYNGATKTVDRESKGVLLYPYQELQKEIESFPATFTEDIKFFTQQYQNEINKFIHELEIARQSVKINS